MILIFFQQVLIPVIFFSYQPGSSFHFLSFISLSLAGRHFLDPGIPRQLEQLLTVETRAAEILNTPSGWLQIYNPKNL